MLLRVLSSKVSKGSLCNLHGLAHHSCKAVGEIDSRILSRIVYVEVSDVLAFCIADVSASVGEFLLLVVTCTSDYLVAFDVILHVVHANGLACDLSKCHHIISF